MCHAGRWMISEREPGMDYNTVIRLFYMRKMLY